MKKAYIIAEIGVNHNGDQNLAKQMVLKAKEAGADAVKFQTFTAEALVTKYAEKAQYQKQTTNSTETQFQMLKKLELSYNDYYELKTLCDSLNIDFLSTPFDLNSIELLERLGLACYKIPSGEITNYPYLVRIGQTNKPVILSTGMCTIDEIDAAMHILLKQGTSSVTLLHCNTQYPTPFSDVNLNSMQTLKERFGVNVGYSDHTSGIEVAIAAVAVGAKVIEKHFTLDNTMEGPDHKASLEPEDFAAMVRAIRNVEIAKGNEKKQPTPSEFPNIVIVRKSIIASKKIKKGQILTEENLTTKRPGDGISPMLWNKVIGTRAIRNFEIDEKIEMN